MKIVMLTLICIFKAHTFSSLRSSARTILPRLSYALRAVSLKTETYLPNHRFWTRTIEIDKSLSKRGTADLLEAIQLEIIENKRDDIPKSEMGVVIVPQQKLFVPINDGILQPQHAITIDSATIQTLIPPSVPNSTDCDRKLCLIIMGFSRRAQHNTASTTEEERPLDMERLVALDNALKSVTDVTGSVLLSEEYAGTPPCRIYRSYVSPRKKPKHSIEPIERSAARTAIQIELALRQVRADRAKYLRNTDRAMNIGSVTRVADGLVLDTTNDIETDGGSTNEFTQRPLEDLNPVVLVLDNLRSAFNVGSIFRTAETAGVRELITCGITCHPPHPKLRKTAFSAVELVPTRHFDDILQAIQSLKNEGYTIAVMETTSLSVQYTRYSYPKKVALVVGNEVTGVDPRVIEAADCVIEIPTFGVKNSLNVASAAPIVLFEVLRQWNDPPIIASSPK